MFWYACGIPLDEMGAPVLHVELARGGFTRVKLQDCEGHMNTVNRVLKYAVSNATLPTLACFFTTLMSDPTDVDFHLDA